MNLLMCVDHTPTTLCSEWPNPFRTLSGIFLPLMCMWIERAFLSRASHWFSGEDQTQFLITLIRFSCSWDIFLASFFPQTACPHWGVLTVRVKASAWSGCSNCLPAFFRANYCIKLLFWHVHVHFHCVGLHKNGCPGPGARHFPSEFSHKMALATCVHVCLGCVHVWGAGSETLSLRHFHCKFSRKPALAEILLTSSLRCPCMILFRPWTEDLVEILVRSSLRGPCMTALQVSCLRGACVKALVGGLGPRSCKVRSSSSRFFFDDLVRFSSGSWHAHLAQFM